MPRILGVDIPPDKPTHISLRYIRGLGPTTSLQVCEKLNLDPQRRAKELSDAEIAAIASLLDRDPRFIVEGPLRRQEQTNIQRLKEIKSYRGERHRKNLPVRGQRSKTNARTRKGVRKTVAGKKGVKDLR
jgi:small subunit ribosomal protein S13